jgi:aquaporin Z
LSSGGCGAAVLSATFPNTGIGFLGVAGYSLVSGAAAEVVLTFMFLVIILGATDGRAAKGFAPIAIGLRLTLIHLVGIPVTNLSVNPARSTGPPIFVGGWALAQLWLLWVAPIIGAALAGLAYSWLSVGAEEPVVGEPEPAPTAASHA